MRARAVEARRCSGDGTVSEQLGCCVKFAGRGLSQGIRRAEEVQDSVAGLRDTSRKRCVCPLVLILRCFLYICISENVGFESQ